MPSNCFVDEDATVIEVLKLMNRENINGVYINDGTRLIGIFTERDYMNRLVLEERKSEETLVKDVMTSSPEFVLPGDSIENCLRKMADLRFRHSLLIVPLKLGEIDYSDFYNGERVCIGILTPRDALSYLYKYVLQEK